MHADESLLPVARAIQLATGSRPHPSTIHRWRIRGIKSVRLETVLVGGRRKCSVESVQRFVAATTAAADGVPTAVRTNRQREAAIDRAERELEADEA